MPIALVPEHVAHTVQAAPSLYWYVDGPLPENAAAVFTMLDPEGVDPLLQFPLALPAIAEIQRIRLADHGIELVRDEVYEWTISIVPEQNLHSDAVIAFAAIRRVDERRLEGRSPTAETYAELGLWYDALQSLTEGIEQTPNDASLAAQRADLLRQVGLEVTLR